MPHHPNRPDTPDATSVHNVATLSVDSFAAVAQAFVTQGKADAPRAESLTRFLIESKRRRLSTSQMAAALGLSATTVSRVFRGIYEGDVAAVADKAALALRLWQEREGRGKVFIETSIARQVFTACDFALNRQTPAIVTGLSQLGKTTAFEEYARRSDAIVRYVRMPAAANLQLFLEELGEALGVVSSIKVNDRRRRLRRALNDRTLLIIDELHELVISTTRAQTRRICEVIRELFDRSHCGLVLCGTEVLTSDLLHGPDAGMLDQVVQRAIEMRLPRRLPKADILAVAKRHGLPETLPEEANIAVRDLRMNRLCLICAMAAEAAAKRGVPLDWTLWLATKRALLGE